MISVKRPRSASPLVNIHKKHRTNYNPVLNKVATPEAAAAVDADPPLPKLLKAIQNGIKTPDIGSSIIYWMRMADLRISDNRALSQASLQAQNQDIPLIVLFILSPQDYVAHDRGARRIDFTLRSLRNLKDTLSKFHIPLHTICCTSRGSVPSRVLSFLSDLGCNNIYANIEYEIDELRRDIKVCDLAKQQGVKATFVHNKCIVEPGVVVTKEGKHYAVYSPYQRNWLAVLNADIQHYLENCSGPHSNDPSLRTADKFGNLFDTPIPDHIAGFELEESDRLQMEQVWPAGEEAAAKILERFLYTKARASQLGAVDPLAPGAIESTKSNRVLNYDKERDRADRDTTSRLSLYLSAGVISSRECVRQTMRLLKINKVEGGSTSGVGRWVQELAWRDFYTNVLAAFPRVSMGRPFLEKYAGVVWENHQAPGGTVQGSPPAGDGEMFQRWKEGTTGVPVVDAAMRCLKKMGWVHNRMRMITAMFLTKDLMIDWHVGERYFMEQLIDGDLASNNGGWQWCASTGVDPCPYFRIFNPYTQSLKVDPTGEFIRHWVPELSKLRGSDLHNPPTAAAKKLGYPTPIVDHATVRQRALRRYKNPGEA
ncbi:DNA photolyase, FAD-binding/Cryptochrome [Infundibulicybe gibba]|nr:DNA photolyase, FAD-binding/Cryptochrome [Infundibulicybe gibba]